MGLIISVVTFGMAVAGIVYGMMLAVEVIGRLQARQKIPALLKRRIALAFVGELCLIGIMFGSFWVGTTGNRALTRSWKSTRNIRAISAALIQYSEDWDNTLPPANRWQDVISTPKYFPAANYSDFFVCPRDSVPCGYAINSAVAGRKIDAIKDPHNTVLLLETRHPGRNASGSASDLAPERHAAVAFPLGFCDGYASRKSRFDMKDVLWSPKQTLPEDKTP